MKAVIAILVLIVVAHAAEEDWKEEVFNESITRLTNLIDEQTNIVKNAAKVHLSAQICVMLARLRFDYEYAQGYLKYRRCTDNSADKNAAKKCCTSAESAVFKNVLNVTDEALICVKTVSSNGSY